ncbi:MAG TPA: hypothetical protein VJ521_05795 [Acidobacteriota bacterium]|nr:hypothetical protein [Acidobacteriota bacterium]
MARQVRKTGLFEIEWATISIRTLKIILFAISGIILLSIYWFLVRNAAPVDDTQMPVDISTARFIDYEGKVEVKPRDEFVWMQATFKMDLHEGDRIRTNPDSSARIKFEDGTEITVQPDTIVIISQGSASDDRSQTPVMLVEEGRSDIKADAATTTVATTKISRFKLAPGSEGTVDVNARTSEHTTEVAEGYGEVTVRGNTTPLKKLEQMKVAKNFETTITKLPFVPPLLSPQKGQVFEFLSDQGLEVELKWRDVSNAVRYHVQISESPLFAKLNAENTNLSKSSVTIRIPKTYKKQYYWRVRSIDEARNKSPWSDPFQFVVQTPGTVKPTLTMDKTPPVLQISYLHPFLPFVQVEGKTEPDAFLTLNGQIIDVKEDGSFVYTYTLQNSGWNDLKFVAEDPSGNKAMVLKRVEYR